MFKLQNFYSSEKIIPDQTYFFTITQALCPPKPNVLLKAALTVRCCDLLKVKLSVDPTPDHQ